MARGKEAYAKQIVNLLRQIEVAVANGKTTPWCGGSGGSRSRRTTAGAREFGGLQVDQAQRLRELEQENAELKRLASELSLEKLVLKDIQSRETSEP